MSKRIIYLYLSLIIDLIGFLSYLIPGIGEFIDFIWAPISALIIQIMYGNILFSIATNELIDKIKKGGESYNMNSCSSYYYQKVSILFYNCMN